MNYLKATNNTDGTMTIGLASSAIAEKISIIVVDCQSDGTILVTFSNSKVEANPNKDCGCRRKKENT